MSELSVRTNLVNFLMKEVGTTAPKGDDKYISYYDKLTSSDFSVDGTPWCAIFVTYCSRENGISTKAIPNFASCTWARDKFFIPNNTWKNPDSYIPQIGDLIFFNWSAGTRASKKALSIDHVGFVVKVENGKIYTVEGNTKGGYTTYGVRYKNYLSTSNYIMGYVSADYDSNGVIERVDTQTSTKTTSTDMIKSYQKWLNTCKNNLITIDGVYGALTKKASVTMLQYILNNQYNSKLIIDGIFGQKTADDVKLIQIGSKNDLVSVAQGMLYCLKYDPKGFDGEFGKDTAAATMLLQKDNSIAQDGKCGKDTWVKMYK